MSKPLKIIPSILYSLAAAVLVGALISAFQPGSFINTWLGTSALLWICLFALLRVWSTLNHGKKLAALLLVAFFARVFLGVLLHQLLPVIGYDNHVQDAGYVYSDAYTRDSEAYRMAAEQVPVFKAFSRADSPDQYGGLLFISTLLYRVLSPDIARPLLVTILGAFTMTLGLAFLYDGIQNRWGAAVATVAGWLYAVYPEGLLLGSSQMREPLLIGLFCIGFWAVLNWRQAPIKKILLFTALLATAVSISVPNGFLMAALLVGFGLVEWTMDQDSKKKKLFGWIGLGAVVLISSVAGWLWLKPMIYYDAYITQISSGWISAIMEQIGEKWRVPFVTIYGLTQPLLPAALTEPSLPIWMTIAIVRAAGWYFVVPFLLYSTFAAWKKVSGENKIVILFIMIAQLAWIGVSSIRAGGDQWDNPRYRAILIPWLVLLVGWAWQRIRAGYKAWFLRWLGVELVFILIITYWYLERYYLDFSFKPSFQLVILMIGVISSLVIGSGLVMDYIYDKKTIIKEKIRK